MAEKTEKEYASEMLPAKRVAYRWYYYKWFILIGIGLAILFTVMIVQIIRKPSSYLAEIVIVNGDNGQAEAQSDYFDEFITIYGYEEGYDFLSVDASYEVDLEDADSTTSASFQVIAASFLSGGIDIFISDEEFFVMEAVNNGFYDLTEVLSDDMLEKYADRFLYVEDPDTGEQIPYGIYMAGTGLDEKGILGEDSYMGIGSQSADTDVDRDLVEYFLEY